MVQTSYIGDGHPTFNRESLQWVCSISLRYMLVLLHSVEYHCCPFWCWKIKVPGSEKVVKCQQCGVQSPWVCDGQQTDLQLEDDAQPLKHVDPRCVVSFGA